MISLLPPNASPLERAAEKAMARLGDIPTPIEDVWNPDTASARALPFLAFGLSIDNWSPEWSDAIKRERIRRAIEIQRRKGTVASVRAVVASLGGAIALREWWQTMPHGRPHSFELVLSLAAVSGATPSASYVDSVIEEVRRTKPVRSHFTFTLAIDAAGKVGLVSALRPAVTARLDFAA
ncbi:MAG TPA: phage tail protein I [Sphingobium sp.]|uniref:phage tail protein I n=1 Tax=Sphingobium sp. TaxID=1912891 RepID=UPI002ED4A6A5